MGDEGVKEGRQEDRRVVSQESEDKSKVAAEVATVKVAAGRRTPKWLFQGGDFGDDDGFGATALVDLADDGDLVAGEGEELGILAAGGSGVGDGPVDGTVVGKDDERRTGLGAGNGALLADGLGKIFGEGTGGVEDVTIDGNGGGFVGIQVKGGREEQEKCESGDGRGAMTVHWILPPVGAKKV